MFQSVTAEEIIATARKQQQALSEAIREVDLSVSHLRNVDFRCAPDERKA